MAKKDNIELFTPERADNLRKELDGKIDTKVSNTTFYWVLGIFVTIILLSFGYTNKVNDKIDSANIKLSSLQTKVDISCSKK